MREERETKPSLGGEIWPKGEFTAGGKKRVKNLTLSGAKCLLTYHPNFSPVMRRREEDVRLWTVVLAAKSFEFGGKRKSTLGLLDVKR